VQVMVSGDVRPFISSIMKVTRDKTMRCSQYPVGIYEITRTHLETLVGVTYKINQPRPWVHSSFISTNNSPCSWTIVFVDESFTTILVRYICKTTLEQDMSSIWFNSHGQKVHSFDCVKSVFTRTCTHAKV
jgi:hypothetical protein